MTIQVCPGHCCSSVSCILCHNAVRQTIHLEQRLQGSEGALRETCIPPASLGLAHLETALLVVQTIRVEQSCPSAETGEVA